MTTTRIRRDSIRIVGALVSKDIVDALKNRTTLSIFFTVIFLVALYRFMPLLYSSDVLPRVVIYSPEQTRLAASLDNRSDLDLRLVETREDMKAYIADTDFAVLGLEIPPGFDQALESGGTIEVDGHLAYWLGDDESAETRAFFEQRLAEIAGRPVTINLDGNTVYARPDSYGQAFFAAGSMIVAVLLVGISLTTQLMLEEKQTKTLDALLVSPATPGNVVVGKALTGLFYCLIVGSIVLVIYANLVTHWWLAILLLVAGSLFAVSLGLLLGTVIELQSQIKLWTFILYQPLLIPVFLVILSDILPQPLLTAFEWIPTVAWSFALRASFAEITPVSSYALPLALLIASTMVLLAATTWFVQRSES
ncbi:MAG: ABC transporter permease [Candidatus Promineifilaceae bacterium]